MNGKTKTLYMQNVEAIRKRTKENLPKKLTGKRNWEEGARFGKVLENLGGRGRVGRGHCHCEW